MEAVVIQPRLWRWSIGCVLLAALVLFGLVLLLHREPIGLVVVFLGVLIGSWTLFYARPMTIVLGESDVEFRTLGRHVRVPYEKLRRVRLVHFDVSMLGLYSSGLRVEGAFSSLLLWYMFLAWFPTVVFAGAIWAKNGWAVMIGSLRFWLVAWVPAWTVIFGAVRFLIVPAMKRIRWRSVSLAFNVDPRLLVQQPFTYFRSRPIVYEIAPFSVFNTADLEQIAAALEANSERLPEGAIDGHLISELQTRCRRSRAAAA